MSMKKEEMKKVIESNKWYTYEQAEVALRKYLNPNNDINVKYLKTKRRQIQNILRSDIIGTYLEIDKRSDEFNEEEKFLKTIYGWDLEETFYLDTLDKEGAIYIENEYDETLHVFPKYDNLFLETERSIILSVWDEQLEDEAKISMREVYESLYNPNTKGRTSYLMTEPYLFALKQEVERREYPSKMLYLVPHSPKEIKEALTDDLNRECISEIIGTILDDFERKVIEQIELHNTARDVEKERYFKICSFLNTWSSIFIEDVDKIITQLKSEGLMVEFIDINSRLDTHFIFQLNIEEEKEKLSSKFNKQELLSKTDRELKKLISNSVYSYEQYSLEKLEISLLQDNGFLLESNHFRHKFGTSLRNYIKEFSTEHSLLLSSLRNNGIR